MINQLDPVKTKTEALPTINRGLLQVRHIQSRLHGTFNHQLETERSLWRTMFSGPIPTLVSRRVE